MEGRLIRGGTLQIFLIVGHIPGEIFKQIFVNYWLRFLSQLYKTVANSQIGTVTCLGGAYSKGAH